MERKDIVNVKKGIDFAFRDFSRDNGEAIEGFFDPLM
jgi:glycine betaine/proline transport system permease protein